MTQLRPEDEPKQGLTFARVLGVAVFLAMIAMWIWVFANRGSIKHPDEFADTAWIASAETVCAERQATIATFANPATVDTAEERARLLNAGTRELEAMVTDVAALGLPTDAKGAELVPQWLDDYELYLQDRRNWSAILETGDDPPFLISGNDEGVRVTDLLSTFAEVNNMASCAPSGDA